MLDWIKKLNKEFPEFWKEYLSKFETKNEPKRFVVLSTETSGLNPDLDVIYSFGAVAVVNDNIIISDSFDVTLLQYKFLHDNQISNEFIIESRQTKFAEPQAIQAFVEYVGNAVLVGHRIDFDVDMINMALSKLDCGRLKNQALDIEIMYKKWKDINDDSFSLDELYDSFKIPHTQTHTSSEDAYNSALLFLKLKSRLGIH